MKRHQRQPPQEQRDYWKKDLRWKRINFGLSFVGFLAIAFGISYNASQISISTEQLKLNTRQVEINTEQSKRLALSICYSLQDNATAHLFTMDKVFIERVYLRPYFYDMRDISEKDKHYEEVLSTTEMMLDLFDLVADFNDQTKGYRECWDDPETWDAWIIDVFKASPIMRRTMQERKTWYADNLFKLYEQAEAQRKAEASP